MAGVLMKRETFGHRHRRRESCDKGTDQVKEEEGRLPANQQELGESREQLLSHGSQREPALLMPGS